MHPLLVNRRNPRVGGANGTGAGAPGAMTFKAGSVTLLSLKPLAIVMVHWPCCGSVKAAVYSPRPAAGTTLALDVSPVAVVARIVGCSPGSKVTPCCRTAKVRFTGFPATAYSGKSSRVTIAQPPANAALMRMNTRAGVVTIRITWFVVIADPFFTTARVETPLSSRYRASSDCAPEYRLA